MKTRLQQTRAYYDSVTKKLNEKAELEKEILQIDTEINNLEQIPFNSECWACQQQPMRIRHVQVSTYKKQMSHVLQKTLKYLQKVHNENSCELDTLVVDLQTKIDELENSLVETMKELRKLEDSVPTGLETLTKGRINIISTNLSNSHKLIKVLKDKVRQYKRNLYAQSIEEKKK
jgi:hypothetical protein